MAHHHNDKDKRSSQGVKIEDSVKIKGPRKKKKRLIRGKIEYNEVKVFTLTKNRETVITKIFYKRIRGTDKDKGHLKGEGR